MSHHKSKVYATLNWSNQSFIASNKKICLLESILVEILSPLLQSLQKHLKLISNGEKSLFAYIDQMRCVHELIMNAA